jgi:hypothetical protein
MNVTGLRSPHDKTGGIVYFGRMIDKIRLHAEGRLPEDYIANLGGGFDLRCVRFLGVSYNTLSEHVRSHPDQADEELLGWCFQNGREPDEERITVWNEYMRKRGWNDDLSERLQQRLAEGGFSHRTDVQTFFDYIDLDEGRMH